MKTFIRRLLHKYWVRNELPALLPLPWPSMYERATLPSSVASSLQTPNLSLESTRSEPPSCETHSQLTFTLQATGALTLADEALTPDCSRFWLREKYCAGQAQESLDKQFVRNHLAQSSDFQTILGNLSALKTAFAQSSDATPHSVAMLGIVLPSDIVVATEKIYDTVLNMFK